MSFFLGISFLPETRTVLSFAQEPLSDIEGIRLLSEENFHLTLKFLGDLSENALSVLDSRLSRIRHPAFSLVFSEIGAFPSLSNPRVIWVGVRESALLFDLARKIDDATENIPRDTLFSPHITVAKCRDDSRVPHEEIFVPPHIFPVSSFALFESIMVDGVRQFVEVKKYDFS